jgi:hypothetical protein
MEKQWNELWLTREQARNMTVTEYKKYAEQLHWKPMEVAWVAKPVNGWDVSRCNGFEE